MKDNCLEILKTKGLIKDYNYVIVSSEQEVIEEHDNRSTEQLNIVFNDDTVLQIDTFCSGSAQNTSLEFDLL